MKKKASIKIILQKIKERSDVKKKDSSGQTFLKRAQEKGFQSIVDLLSTIERRHTI